MHLELRGEGHWGRWWWVGCCKQRAKGVERVVHRVCEREGGEYAHSKFSSLKGLSLIILERLIIGCDDKLRFLGSKGVDQTAFCERTITNGQGFGAPRARGASPRRRRAFFLGGSWARRAQAHARGRHGGKSRESRERERCRRRRGAPGMAQPPRSPSKGKSEGGRRRGCAARRERGRERRQGACARQKQAERQTGHKNTGGVQRNTLPRAPASSAPGAQGSPRVGQRDRGPALKIGPRGARTAVC